MSREEFIAYCLTYQDAVADCPFAEEAYTVLRHRSNKKWFALVIELDGKLCVNLKADPLEADFLRRVYPGVRPAWHMNKVHWNTVEVNGVPWEELTDMVAKSFALTASGKKNKNG